MGEKSDLIAQKDMPPPESWKTDYCIYKKGDVKNCQNYRPITLLDTSRKWFCKMLAAFEPQFWNDLPPTQARFRKDFFTCDHIFSLVDIGVKYLNAGKPLYAAFVDLNKAFDSILRPKIWEALVLRKCDQMVSHLLQKLYHDNTIQVRLGNQLSKSVAVRWGSTRHPLSPCYSICTGLSDVKVQ